MIDVITLEIQRQKTQIKLDGLKNQRQRNEIGQFSTPILLAKDILNHTSKFLNKNTKISFLDPAFGMGSFFSALLSTFSKKRIKRATGFEIDPGSVRFFL